MLKTIITVILTVLAVLFSTQNFDHVPVYFFWGEALNIRLVFVIAISGGIGYLIRHFIGIVREDKLKRKLYHLLKRKKVSMPDKELYFDDDI